MSAGDLDQVLGLITCEQGLFSDSAKPATAAGIVAVDPRFRLQFVRKFSRRVRQDMRWRNDCGASALFSTATHMLI